VTFGSNSGNEMNELDSVEDNNIVCSLPYGTAAEDSSVDSVWLIYNVVYAATFFQMRDVVVYSTPLTAGNFSTVVNLVGWGEGWEYDATMWGCSDQTISICLFVFPYYMLLRTYQLRC